MLERAEKHGPKSAILRYLSSVRQDSELPVLQQLLHSQNTVSKVQIKKGKERTTASSVCLTISSFLLLLTVEITKTEVAVTKYGCVWEAKDYPEALHGKNGFFNKLARILSQSWWW